ncbi:MAG: hypothetical protein QOH21_3652 [Acidobacteriota bacterium]|jgi:hypothetical protein|nr:hypothetical protein [Acidobacteriota bacterium]
MTYQVPMVEVAVTLALDGAEPEEHFLYLAPYSDRRDGAETVADYLNGRRRFLPMLAGGVPRILNRDRILWLRFERLPDVVETESTLIEKLTILELADGTRIEGVVPIDRPPEESRLSDVLNDLRETFLRIDDEEETYYVHKTFIRSVIPR